MRTTISAQQGSYFTKNGHIEFEFDVLIPEKSLSRDTWRRDEALKAFILRKLAPLALALTGKKRIRLGLDQWFSAENRPAKPGPLKELFCLQNLSIAMAIAPEPSPPPRKSPLGILPQPTQAGHLLCFRPELILDWPHVQSDVFIVLFTEANGLYVHNPKDPLTGYLKPFGLQYGDLLRNETHPLIF